MECKVYYEDEEDKVFSSNVSPESLIMQTILATCSVAVVIPFVIYILSNYGDTEHKPAAIIIVAFTILFLIIVAGLLMLSPNGKGKVSRRKNNQQRKSGGTVLSVAILSAFILGFLTISYLTTTPGLNATEFFKKVLVTIGGDMSKLNSRNGVVAIFFAVVIFIIMMATGFTNKKGGFSKKNHNLVYFTSFFTPILLLFYIIRILKVKTS